MHRGGGDDAWDGWINGTANASRWDDDWDDDSIYERVPPVKLAIDLSLMGVALAVAIAYVLVYGFDGPIRADGVASSCSAAGRAAHCKPQGRLAVAYLVLGTALFIAFGASRATVQVRISAAVCHLLGFLLLAVYPGCLGKDRGCCSSKACSRVYFAVVGWSCCVITACCCAPNFLFTSCWYYYFCPFTVAIGSIDTARWVAFTMALRRGPRRPADLPPQSGPEYAHNWYYLPPIATDFYVDAEAVPTVELATVAPAPLLAVTVQPLPAASLVVDAGPLPLPEPATEPAIKVSYT